MLFRGIVDITTPNIKPIVARNYFMVVVLQIRKAAAGSSPTEAAEATRRQIAEDLGLLGVDSVDMLMLRDSPDCDVTQVRRLCH